MNQTNRDTAGHGLPLAEKLLQRTFETYLGETPMLMALAAAMFPAILTTTLLVDDPRLAVTLLYSIPIALFASLLGLCAGLIAALVSSALLLAVAVPFSWDLGGVGYAVRLTTFFAVAVSVGWFSDRLRKALSMEISRRHQVENAHDSVIQPLDTDGAGTRPVDDYQADH